MSKKDKQIEMEDEGLKPYFFVSFTWMKKNQGAGLALAGKQQQPLMSVGEGWVVLDRHPYVWCMEELENNQMIITLRNYFMIHKDEYEFGQNVITAQSTVFGENMRGLMQ